MKIRLNSTLFVDVDRDRLSVFYDMVLKFLRWLFLNFLVIPTPFGPSGNVLMVIKLLTFELVV